jgi:hypothetical protein
MPFPVRATALFLLAPLCALARPACAQSVQWIRATAGLEQSALNNPGESAFRYSGIGPAFALQYQRTLGDNTFDIALGGSFGTLRSKVTTATSNLTTATLRTRFVRGAPRRTGPVEWTFGADLTGHVETTQHQYAGPFGSDDVFGFLTIGAGPVVRTRYRLSHATIVNELAVPLANLVDFPYANAKMNGDQVKLSFASLDKLQAFDDAVSYRVGAPGKPSVTWTYRLSYLRYLFADARRVAHQSLSMTLDLPFKGGR